MGEEFTQARRIIVGLRIIVLLKEPIWKSSGKMDGEFLNLIVEIFKVLDDAPELVVIAQVELGEQRIISSSSVLSGPFDSLVI